MLTLDGWRSYAEIHRELGLTRQQVREIIKDQQLMSEGKINKNTLRKKLKAEHTTFIKEYLLNPSNCTKTLKQIRSALVTNFALEPNYVSLPTLRLDLQKLGFSRKRTVKVDPNKNKREVILQRKVTADTLVQSYKRHHNVVYIDEVGFSSTLRSNYGYAQRGKTAKVVAKIRDKNISVIAAMNSKKILGWMIFNGSVTSKDFFGFLSKIVYKLRTNVTGDSPIFLFDKASIQKSGLIQEVFLHEYAAIFSAPYSPELNPIELAFSKVKQTFRKLMDTETNNIVTKICSSFLSVRPLDVKGYMQLHLQYLEQAHTKLEL